MNISISREGVELGEYAEEQVRAMYQAGELLPTDFYWKEGMTEWGQLNAFVKPRPPTSAVTSGNVPPVAVVVQALPPDKSAKGVSSITAFIIFAITLICLVYLFFQVSGSGH